MITDRRPTKVIILGGDDRIHRMRWPRSVEIRAYTRDEVHKAEDSIRSGSVGEIYVLVKWMGHAQYETLKAAADRAKTPFRTWYQGMGQLAEELTKKYGAVFSRTASQSPTPAVDPDLERQAAEHRERTERTMTPAVRDSIERYRRQIGSGSVTIPHPSPWHPQNPLGHRPADPPPTLREKLEALTPHQGKTLLEQIADNEVSVESLVVPAKKRRVANVRERMLKAMVKEPQRIWTVGELGDLIGADMSGMYSHMARLEEDESVVCVRPKKGPNPAGYRVRWAAEEKDPDGKPWAGMAPRDDDDTEERLDEAIDAIRENRLEDAEKILSNEPEQQEVKAKVAKQQKKKITLRYTIKVVVDVPAEDPQVLDDILESCKEHGTAEVDDVELIKDDVQ